LSLEFDASLKVDVEEDVVMECQASLDEMRKRSIAPIEKTFYSFLRGHIL
jgi:hypothetical protein